MTGSLVLHGISKVFSFDALLLLLSFVSLACIGLTISVRAPYRAQLNDSCLSFRVLCHTQLSLCDVYHFR
jgi:hypothetical protein